MEASGKCHEPSEDLWRESLLSVGDEAGARGEKDNVAAGEADDADLISTDRLVHYSYLGCGCLDLMTAAERS